MHAVHEPLQTKGIAEGTDSDREPDGKDLEDRNTIEALFTATHQTLKKTTALLHQDRLPQIIKHFVKYAIKHHKGDHVVDAHFAQYLQHIPIGRAKSKHIYELTDLTVSIPSHMLLYVNIEVTRPAAADLKPGGKRAASKIANINRLGDKVVQFSEEEHVTIMQQLPGDWD